MKLPLFIGILFILSGCLERQNPSVVTYSTPALRKQAQDERRAATARTVEQERLRVIAKKKSAWKKITVEAKDSYQDIASIMKKKCSDCHDQRVKLPLYGRILRRYNPIYKHQKDGLAAIDFSAIFPLKTSDGYKPEKSVEIKTSATEQISFLNALRESVVRRTMPLRSYTALYRGRRVFDNDEKAIVAWVDLLIEKLRDFSKEYETDIDDGSVAFKVGQVFKNKCYRCHANANQRGNFGGMEDLDKLILTKYINRDEPESSGLYQEVLTGEMPISASERLTEEELSYVLEWIKNPSS